MPIQQIGVGAAPNDGTGDQLRTAFQKVNANSLWLTNKIGTSDTQIQLSGDIGVRFLDMTASNEVFEDIVFPIATLNPVGIGSPANLVATSGQSGLDMALEYTTNNTLYVAAQMPHTWNPGTDVFPHIHIQPQFNILNTIQWQGWYSISDLNGTFPVSTAIAPFNTNIPAGNQWKHLLMAMPPAGISMAGFAGPSTIVRLKFQVVSVTNPFHAISFDVHYEWGGSPVVYPP
jgi:hypothetical protein